MPTRLFRSFATLLLMLLASISMPALAVNKTVNGITVDINLPQIQRGVPYSFQIAPTGPTGYSGAYTFQRLSGILPGGISIDSTGLVSGTTCSSNGSYAGQNLRIRTASNPPGTIADFTGNNAFSVNVTTAPANGCSLTLTATAGSGTQGQAYTGSVTASNGTGPYTYSVVGGSLPPGVTLDPNTGALSGTPTTPGTYSFYVQATDSGGATGVTANSIDVSIASASGVTITVAPGTLPGGTSGTAYSETLSASGGTGPYTFSRTVGGLPAGLVLNATTGVLSGTPTAAGTYTFTIRATDANATDFGEQAYSVTIAGGDILTLTPATLPGGTSGTAYAQAVTASGGDGGPYTYSVSAGALPAGLSLNTATGDVPAPRRPRAPTPSPSAHRTATATSARAPIR